MIVVGISGKARAGKDTLAQYLSSHYDSYTIALADPIKRMALHLGATADQLWGPSGRETPIPYKTPEGQDIAVRLCLTALGTEVGRLLSPNLWLDICAATIELLKAEVPHGLTHAYSHEKGVVLNAFARKTLDMVIIPDLRFENEMRYVRERLGGVIFRITRSDVTTRDDLQKHSSETEQDGVPDTFFDRVLRNDGTMEQFASNVGEPALETIRAFARKNT